MPGHMGQRVAVEQQQGRPVAAMPQMNPRTRGLDLSPGKAFKHSHLLGSGQRGRLAILRAAREGRFSAAGLFPP